LTCAAGANREQTAFRAGVARRFAAVGFGMAAPRIAGRLSFFSCLAFPRFHNWRGAALSPFPVSFVVL
jgi:hypothetical protein